jgi:hypothetical protein
LPAVIAVQGLTVAAFLGAKMLLPLLLFRERGLSGEPVQRGLDQQHRGHGQPGGHKEDPAPSQLSTINPPSGPVRGRGIADPVE